MKVWRLEDACGRGPYNRVFTKADMSTEAYEILKQLRFAHMDMATHPNAIHDDLYHFINGDNYSGNKVFGFPSEALALEWFDGFLDDLYSIGFKLKEFNAYEYKIGFSGKQLVFNRAKT